ncbi:hypothetical protein DFJ58DRAFT_822015 [Suillus subalutaceus]|uniref:uncharacterized protein n=1 Tax=Suillus subalutaceus TaxID=48586 RepID=UPI001B871DEE|nr:uncharacterized protein DFJ58DRAFT_822015 [Suillus subalutaceus]KAG1833646.1 hypothetical protein DFJ58DRAFT_822015 [Suillus subalutaceus]
MRFSSAIFFVVVAALTSSISARPHDDGSMLARSAQCSTFCVRDSQCTGCAQGYCTPLFCQVSRVFALTSVQYGRWF